MLGMPECRAEQQVEEPPGSRGRSYRKEKMAEPLQRNASQDRRLQALLFLLPVAMAVFFLYAKLALPRFYHSLIQEDSILENAQAVFYLAASAVALLAAAAFRRRKMFGHGALHGALALGLLLVFLEEISWGQRIGQIATPAFFEHHNVQKEISLHNLRLIQGKLRFLYMFIGLYGATAWVLVARRAAKAPRRSLWPYMAPDWFLSPYFLAVFLIHALLVTFRPHEGHILILKDQEPAELLLAMGFLAFMVVNFRKLKRQRPET